MKICLVCASGGHLTEMLRLNDAFIQHDIFLITYREEFLDCHDPGEIPANIARRYSIENYLVTSLHKNLFERGLRFFYQLIVVTAMEVMILLRERPDVIISTGSGIAIPIFYFGRLLGTELIFIESLCRIRDISHTGKMVRPISDYFIVQWQPLTERYKLTIFKGNLLDSCGRPGEDMHENREDLIFVTVGTTPFPRLIKKMDEIAQDCDIKMIMQIGRTDYEPKNAEYFRFTEYDEFLNHMKNARVIVMHPGAGTLLTVLGLGKRPIVVARLQEHGECLDDDQNEIVKILAQEERIELANSIDEIPSLLRRRIAESSQRRSNEIPGAKKNGLVNYLKTILSKRESSARALKERG